MPTRIPSPRIRRDDRELEIWRRDLEFDLYTHASRHQDGGDDEIDVTNLAGVLADLQKPQDHTHQSSGSGVGGKLDHGLALNGLTDDDHTQYILVAGTRAFTGNQSFGDFNITDVGDISLDRILSDSGTTIDIVLGTDAGDDFAVNNGSDILLIEGDTGLSTFTGNVLISKADPTLTLTDTADSNSAVLTRTDSAGSFTVKNTVLQSGAGYGNALTFNGGASEYVFCGSDSSLDATTALTLVAWVKFDSITANNYIFSKGELTGGVTGTLCYGMAGTNVGGKYFKFYISLSGTATAVTFTAAALNDTTSWHHIAVVWNGSTASLYIDGSFSESQALVGTIDINSDAQLIIGWLGGGIAATYLYGTVDEAAVYKRLLTTNDISDLYAGGIIGLRISPSGTFPTSGDSMGTNLAALYHFDESAMNSAPGGTDVEDDSGNGNHGTCTGTMVDGDFDTGIADGSLPVDVEVTVIQSKDSEGEDVSEAGKCILGHESGRTVLDGKTVWFSIGGSYVGNIDANGHFYISGDSKALYFGVGNDFSILYNGSGAIIRSDEVTATDYLQLRGGTNGIKFNIGATEQIILVDGALKSTTDDDVDLGAIGAEFKDLFIDGTANIDSLIADTADINAGTIDGTTVGGSSAAAGTFTNLTGTGDIALGDGDDTITLNPTTAVSFSDKNISNVGDIALDSITADDGTGPITVNDDILINSTEKINFLDSAIGMYSQADTFMDFFADGAVRIGNSSAGAPTTYVSFEPDGDMFWTGDGSGLPFAEIYAADANDTITITLAGKANKVQVTSFSADGLSNNMTPDHTNDHITVVKAGMYSCDVSLHIKSAAAGGADTIGYSVYKNNGATEFTNLHGQRSLSGGGIDEASSSLSGIIDLAVNDTIELWIWNNDSADDVIVDDVNLRLIQIGGT